MAPPPPAAFPPDPRHLALALTVVRSKPPHLSIAEYLECMRKSVVRRDRRPVTGHLDIVQLWQSRYEQTQQDLKAARAETEALKLEVEALRAESSNSTRKNRKSIGARSSSPVKASGNSPHKSSPTTLEVLEGLDIRPLSGVGTKVEGSEALLIRHVYDIHAIFDQQVKLDSQELAYHLVRSTEAVLDVVREIVQPTSTGNNNTAQSLEGKLLGLARIVSYLLLAIARLSRSSRGHETQGRVVYSTVEMFSQILQIMIDTTTTMRCPDNDKRPLERRSTRISTATKSEPITDVPSLLARFLCTVIARLDLRSVVHRDVLEGCSFSTVQKAGDVLYALTFGHKRRETLEQEILHSETLPDVIDGHGPTIGQVSAPDAPYLLQLVRYISKATDACEELQSSHHLATTAKERLQRTLLNCTFGTEGLDDGHPFLDCLKLPMAPVEPIPAPTAEESISEWYTRELWGWIGWDIVESELTDPNPLL